jgi:hypothetical protein
MMMLGLASGGKLPIERARSNTKPDRSGATADIVAGVTMSAVAQIVLIYII